MRKRIMFDLGIKTTVTFSFSKLNHALDEIIPDINEDEIVTAEIKTFDSNECSLTTNETDSFAFGDAFKHYRQCLGDSENFNWKGNSYTTQLEKEKIKCCGKNKRNK